MGNVYMEAEQVRFKDSTYHNLQTAVKAALEGGGGGGTTVIANPEGSATDGLSKLQVGTTIYGIPAEAGDISYDNTSSGMTADDVQEAIDELSAAMPGVATTSAPGIVQPDGTTITVVDGVISAVGGSGGEVFSTTETLIGTWNGANLYRKIFNIASLPNNTSTAYDTNLPTTYDVKRCYGTITSSDNWKLPLPFVHPVTIESCVLLIIDNNNKISIRTGTDRTSDSAEVILEYTKS